MTKYDDGEDHSQDDQLVEVVRDTVQQLERLTKRLQSYIETNDEEKSSA